MQPSDQRKVIEPARFPHTPLGKEFEEKIKTIEDQKKKKQKHLKKQLVKPSSEKESLTHLKQKEVLEEIANEIVNEINNLGKKKLVLLISL